MTLGLARRLAAEGAGTFFLVATVVGTGLMGERMTGDIGLQLLANAAATAAMLGVLISLLAPISGAHFNPAVSLVMCLRRVLSWSELAPYALAQVAGGILGTLIAHAMFGEPLLQVSTQVRAGLPLGVSEVVAGFGLVSVVLLGGARTPVLVAAYIGAAYWFTASTSFGSVKKRTPPSPSGSKSCAPASIAASSVSAPAGAVASTNPTCVKSHATGVS